MSSSSRDTKRKVMSGLIWKFGERFTAQAVSLVVSIILARLLMPENYGSVALVMIFISLANVFVSNGFGSALIQEENADNVDFSSVFYASIVLSVFMYAVLFAAAPFIADFFSEPVIKPTLRVLGIRIIVAAINSVQQAYVSRNLLFKRFFWSTLIGTVVSGIVGIYLAYKGFGIWALVAQYMTNTCTDTVVLWITVKWRPDPVFSWERVVKLLSYGWKILVSSLINTGYNQLRSLFIGKFYSKSDLAFYNKGENYPSLIVTNIDASISGVIFPVMSQSQNDPARIKAMTRKAVQVSSYVMWPMMLGLGACAEPFIRLLLTEKWLPCIPYLRVLAFSYGLWPIHTANLQAIKAIGRSDLFLRLEVIKKIIGIVILLAVIRFGPFMIALSMAFTSIVSTYINSKPNQKLLNYSFGELLKDMLPSLLMAAVMGLIVYLMSYLPLRDFPMLVLQVFAGAVLYVGFSVVTKNSSFYYLLDTIRNKKQTSDGVQ